MLAGLIKPTGGTVTVDGTPAAESVGTVALSFQHARLQLQRPTVAEDILAAAGFDARLAAAEEGPDAFVRTSLHRVGLPAELAGRSVDELSGGQMRRVAIAGLLASRPRVLILDEPLAGLDRESRRGLLELLGHMRRTDGLTLVVISHDLEDMGLACTRTVAVTDGTVALPGAPPGPSAAAPPARPRAAAWCSSAVPGTSALHRHRPGGEDRASLAAATIVSFVVPDWPTIIVLTVLLAAGVAAARLPLTVVPRDPVAGRGGHRVRRRGGGRGRRDRPATCSRLLLTILFFGLSLLLIWTTRVEDLPAAFTRIAWPLRRLGLPVSEWAHTDDVRGAHPPAAARRVPRAHRRPPAAPAAADGQPAGPAPRPRPRAARHHRRGRGLGRPPGVRPRPHGHPARRHALVRARRLPR